ncbi:MAG TPA: hypothetical protein PKC54_14860 [Ferruginibacter sp.]|nr:hypothetical protein [Ferruginibacter sp.]
MKQFILKNKKAMGTLAALLLVGGITMSFQDSPFSYNKFSVQESTDFYRPCRDTVPDRNYNGSIKMKDFDKLQSELDRSLSQLSDELKKIDFSKMEKEIEASLKSIDADKIMRDVERSLKDIDLDKTLASVTSSLKDLDLDFKGEEIEIEKAMAEAKKEIEKAKKEISKIDKDAIKKELEEARKEVEKSKAEINKIDMDKIMSEAKESINEAKEELKQTKELITELEKDGLVNTKNGFELEYKDKSLYIDGKKQSAEVTDKYRKYFKKDSFKIRIEKE